MAQTSIVDEFMKKLQEAERTGDVKDLVTLFSEGAECTALTRHNVHAKNEGQPQSPTQFWRQYLKAFDSIQSKFNNVIDNGRFAVLEWHSTGCLPMGLPIDYNGVSILEYDADNVHKFRTYYDSAALLPYAARAEKTHSQTVGNPEINATASS